jgi:formylglycine-generating enzyme required for sulfatase activity
MLLDRTYVRGGSWGTAPKYLRSAERDFRGNYRILVYVGFRVTKSLKRGNYV